MAPKVAGSTPVTHPNSGRPLQTSPASYTSRVEVISEAALFVFVRLHSAPGNEDAIRAALTMVVRASRAEPGCVSIHAFRSARDPRLFFIHSVWTDADAFDRHARMPHTVEFIETVDQLLDEPREVIRTHQVA